MNKDEANHQDKSRKPAPHISMELKADSARVTNLQMEGSRLILTIEAELSESQVKAADPEPGFRAAAAETVAMPPIILGADTEETPRPESVSTSSTIEDALDDQESPESPIFSLPDAVAAGVDNEGELASEAIEERILEEVFSVGADKDTVETMNPLSLSGGAVAPSSYGARPAEGEGEKESSDPLHAFSEAPADISAEESPKATVGETTVAVQPSMDDSISYERLEDEIRKVKGRETSVQYKRPYSEDVSGAEKATDESSLLPGRQADDTVPLPAPTTVMQADEIDEDEDTLAAIKPDAYSEVLAAEQSEKARVEREHFNTETGPLPFYSALTQGASHGERSEDLDTATQQISYQNMSEQDKDATYNQNSLERDEEQHILESQDRSTEHLLYDQEKNQEQEQDAAAAIEPEPAETVANPDSSVFEFDQALADNEQQPEQQAEAPQAVEEPVARDDKVLTVAPEDLDNDDVPVLSEESSAFGGERHGEPLPSINFGFDPIPTAQEKPAAEEPLVETPQEEKSVPEHKPEQEPEPELEQEQEQKHDQQQESDQEQEIEQEQEQTQAEEPPVQPEATEPAVPEAELPTEPTPQTEEKQESENSGPSLNTGEPPRTPTGGTTVLIRYTCPKCKTQGMQAVDKVGTVVNCTNCGKAMRLVMKK